MRQIIRLCCAAILLIGASLHANPLTVRCSGLTLERLANGYALTHEGIVFATEVGDSHFIYHHIPYSSDDLTGIMYCECLEYLVDIVGSDLFAIWTGKSYLICDPYQGLVEEEVDIPSFAVRIYDLADFLLFVSYDGQNHVTQIHTFNRSDGVMEISSRFAQCGAAILDVAAYDGKVIALCPHGLVVDDGIETRFLGFSHSQLIDEPALLIGTSNGLFLTSELSVSRLALGCDQATLQETHVIPGPVQVFCLDSATLIRTSDMRLQDWVTGKEVEGCEKAIAYLEVNGYLYGIQDTPLLMPY